MPRPKYIPNSQFPYHVTARVRNKEWYELPMHEVWNEMENHLYFIHHAFDVRIHAFVLMSNHFHLLISTPKANLAEAMQYFMTQTSKSIADKSNRTNQIYGGRYSRCLIRSYHHYMNAYKYVYRNPIEAGLCESAEQYSFSTLSGLIGNTKLTIPITNDTLLFPDSIDWTLLNWINQAPLKSNYNDMKRAMRQSEFKLSKWLNQQDGKLHLLEREKY